MIKLIALDLDGTLLDREKKIPSKNKQVLECAANSGAEIVFATGRYYTAIPAELRCLPYSRYVITENGAQVLDLLGNQVIYSADLPLCRAVDLISQIRQTGAIVGCYQSGAGWMSDSDYDQIDSFTVNAANSQLIRASYSPVADMEEHILKTGKGLQKVSAFFRSPEERDKQMAQLSLQLPVYNFSRTIETNIEINSKEADKGIALKALCSFLGISLSETMVIGDELNDLPMLLAAGKGVAMGNAPQEVKDAADEVTLDCDHAGVAYAIEKHLTA